MRRARRLGGSFALVAAAGAMVAVACGDGSGGAGGAIGVAGPPGDAGPGVGVAPDAATAVNGGCLAPCHNSLTSGAVGVVDQWRQTGHARPVESVVGPGACGNCHAIDGLAQRLASDGGARGRLASATGAEVAYGGVSPVGQIFCSTCHAVTPETDPHVTGRYVPGQTPILVPGNVNETVLLEKTDGLQPTPVAYSAGNICVFCHKSRKDVSLYITATGNTLSSARWGPHSGPQADVYSGKGGYQFTGQTYGTATHTSLANGCVGCHMVPAAANGDAPDHTMKPTLAQCRTCHTDYTGTNFDIDGGQTLVRNALRELEQLLNDRGLLTRSEAAPFARLTTSNLADDEFQRDAVRPGNGTGDAVPVVDGPTAGALYDYLVVARGKDLGAHNPTYARQLLWDSIRQLKGADPASMTARP